MTPPEYTFIDFETRSLAPLKKIGGRAYAQHATTEVLCLSMLAGDEMITIWDPIEYPFDARIPCLVAHNAISFDRFIWSRLGWPEPERWLDSAVLARRAGLPSSIAKLGKRMGLPKDVEGRKLTVALSRKSRKDPTRFQIDPIPAETRDRVMQYCEQDVRVMARAVREHLEEYDWARYEPGTWQAFEERVLQDDIAIQDRGIAFDEAYANALLSLEERDAAEKAAEVGVRIDQVRSNNQFRDLMHQHGIDLPNAQRETLREYAHSPLVAARLAATSITSGKIRRGLAMCLSGRLYDTTRYYGAHTGRWAGQGMQTQNLPRGDASVQTSEMYGEILAGRATTLTPVQRGGLLRGALHAPQGKMLVVCDYSGIEARVLAWLAEDEAAIQAFRDGVDPYVRIAAEAIFFCAPKEISKTQRTIGKIAELALGYGMGYRKFEEQAGAANLKAAGVTAYRVVQQWRQLRSPVVELWRDLDREWRDCDGDRIAAYDDDTIRMTLPSGRQIVYQDPQGDSYFNGHDYRVRVYGGLLTENLVQATARDLLADAIVQATRAGLNPVMTCHDEIVCEVPERCAEDDLRTLEMIMSEDCAPAWARGCPITCEGYVAKRYRK